MPETVKIYINIITGKAHNFNDLSIQFLDYSALDIDGMQIYAYTGIEGRRCVP